MQDFFSKTNGRIELLVSKYSQFDLQTEKWFDFVVNFVMTLIIAWVFFPKSKQIQIYRKKRHLGIKVCLRFKGFK